MKLEQVSKPWFTIGHALTTAAMIGSVLVYANATENKTVANETKLEIIQANQKEIKQDAKEIRKGQREIERLLIEIKTRVEQGD